MKDDDRIQSDGITVWVHDASDGSCIGRFGRLGIDIHRPASEQSTLGECLLCTHGPTGADEWRRFIDAMDEIYGVTVTESHRPRHIASPRQEITMQKIQTYVVTGEHQVVPGQPLSVHFTEAAADAAALDLVRSMAANVPDAPPVPEQASDWRKYLTDVQRAIIAENYDPAEIKDDDLEDQSGCYVDIAVVEADAPRVFVCLDGGLVQGIVSDIALDAYVLDYDVEGTPLRDLIDIPQDGGSTSEATVHGESADVDPAWIDSTMRAYEAHDPDAGDDEIEEDEIEEKG